MPYREDHVHRARLNEESRRYATRSKQPWSAEDDAVLIDRLVEKAYDEDETVAVAHQLKRTFEAVHMRTSTLRAELGIKRYDGRTRSTTLEKTYRCPVDDDYTSNPEWYQ